MAAANHLRDILAVDPKKKEALYYMGYLYETGDFLSLIARLRRSKGLLGCEKLLHVILVE